MHFIGLGEQLDAEQVEAVFKDCMGEENDDGEIQYARKYICFRSSFTFTLFLERFDFHVVSVEHAPYTYTCERCKLRVVVNKKYLFSCEYEWVEDV